MQTRPLGKTGVDVSILGLGTASLGNVFGAIDEAEGERAVRTALDLGVNLIDSSPYYGHTRSETVLGRALRGVDRDRYVLATKVGRYGLDDFDFSPDRIRTSLDESLGRLGVERIDLLQLHDIEFGCLQTIVAESIPAMQELRAAGKIRFFGITGLPLPVLQEVAAQGAPDTVLSYCHYALNDDTLEPLLPWFAARGVGVINASSTGMALLTAKGPPNWHPADEAIQRVCREAVEWCQTRGVNITRLALQFATANPGIATTLVGTASCAEITENVAWIDEPIDPEVLAAVRGILSPIRGRSWPSGRQENR